MKTDRIFGLFIVIVALAFIASATQIQTSFLADPVGPKTFPFLIGAVMALCGLMLVLRPDDEQLRVQSAGKVAYAVVVLLGYAYALRPLGFLIPTAIASGLVSYQISPRVTPAVMTGVGLSIGLFVLFKFVLGLGLFAVPRTWFG